MRVCARSWRRASCGSSKKDMTRWQRHLPLRPHPDPLPQERERVRWCSLHSASRWQRHWQPTIMDASLTNPVTGRLSVQTVERLHRLLGGDAHVEGMVLQFIADKYAAKNLLYLPPQVAKEILKRPADFLRAVNDHCEPELKF